MNPFRPDPASGVSITVSTSSQAVQLKAQPANFQVRVMNNGTATVWIEFGTSTVTASTSTGIPIGPGGTEIFSFHNTSQSEHRPYVAAIAVGSPGKIYFSTGDGE